MAKWGIDAVDEGAIMERLRGIDATLLRIESERLRGIEDHLRTLNGRVGEAEKWQSGADAMLDSLNERVSENTDNLTEHIKTCNENFREHQSYIDKQEGGMSARAKTFVDITVLAGVLIALVKLFLFHN